MPKFTQTVSIPVPAEFLYQWHSNPGAFERLAPPWESVEVSQPLERLEDGQQTEIRVGVVGPIKQRWLAELKNVQPGRQFEDTQLAGPFAAWHHRHLMTPAGDESSILTDDIEYRVPFGFLGAAFGGGIVRRKLRRMFDFRHRVTKADAMTHFRTQQKHPDRQPMKVLISGRSGLVGSELATFLTSGGHSVAGLTRSPDKQGETVAWDPQEGTIDSTAIADQGFDSVVHLAGESIQGRWTKDKKRRIRNSRTEGTRLLCESLAAMENPPKTLVCASAIGYYGDRGDEELTEDSPPGESFLADVCQEWEAACEPAREKGIRVVNVRIGVVLTPKGGALSKVLTPFKLGGGGKVGSGKQWWSWIAIEDLVGIIHHALTEDDLSGPINATAPNPVTNKEFTKTLGKVLSRPTIIPLPGFAAKLALGEMADELLLASAKVLPNRTLESGYSFRYPELEPALRHLLGK
ncbi:TIGR01777 family oxidoreductase [Thalassoroseus pseudoceratinae]|uniref:TIGR01777 family oxidoreductase n=1 Tax=Thalassoroseus pseudoceratinae TaxID=2713176 RepID=UPI00141E56BB|nr:TIGR01777 family oxidoreductase [Thalassoroseus pseudoceratinae]